MIWWLLLLCFIVLFSALLLKCYFMAYLSKRLHAYLLLFNIRLVLIHSSNSFAVNNSRYTFCSYSHIHHPNNEIQKSFKLWQTLSEKRQVLMELLSYFTVNNRMCSHMLAYKEGLWYKGSWKGAWKSRQSFQEVSQCVGSLGSRSVPNMPWHYGRRMASLLVTTRSDSSTRPHKGQQVFIDVYI